MKYKVGDVVSCGDKWEGRWKKCKIEFVNQGCGKYFVLNVDRESGSFRQGGDVYDRDIVGYAESPIRIGDRVFIKNGSHFGSCIVETIDDVIAKCDILGRPNQFVWVPVEWLIPEEDLVETELKRRIVELRSELISTEQKLKDHSR